VIGPNEGAQEYTKTRNSFVVLTAISRLLIGFGCLLIVGGFLYAVIIGIIEPLLPDHHSGAADVLDLLTGFSVAFSGIITVAGGEVIGVAFVIEANTRRTADAVASMAGKR
jgi:hypothetical protein